MNPEITTPPRRRVAAVYLMRSDGAVLLQHRDDKPGLRRAGMWVPPGGHCEPGEPDEVCARRELLEETGYDCATLHRLAAIVDDPQDGGPPLDLRVFWSTYDGVQSIHCLEGQAMQFVERDLAEARSLPCFLIELWDEVIAIMSEQSLIPPSSSAAAGTPAPASRPFGEGLST